ncbi:HNH endonuclease [Vibrio bathopelagicus]|uniref:HNH endonuclease n=1 Tax=Vibrio bathopelagicus TaxID=2777577 RepID=UPI001CF5B603|nr:HNH endonuclease signature motif containing protein [Vibrio bathopelagicus]
MIKIYSDGDSTIWVPVANRSEKFGCRAFLPEPNVDTYIYGYKAKEGKSEGDYLSALTDIQRWHLKNEQAEFLIKSGTEYQNQYRARWRHGRKVGSPILGPTLGWVEVLFEGLSQITADDLTEKLEKFGVNVSGNLVCNVSSYELAPVTVYDDSEIEQALPAVTAKLGTRTPKGQEVVNKRKAEVIQYHRDVTVVAYILKVTGGNCELCGSKAPFVKENGQPYLEVHHVKFLSEGGSDTITNATALCPNCHRALHNSIDKENLREELYEKVSRLVREHS